MKNIDYKQIKEQLNNYKVEYFESVSSTNKLLKSDEYLENTLLITEEQTNGIGRLNRNFVSKKSKGIYMSLKIKPTFDLNNINKLTPSIGVIISNSIFKQTNIHPNIKWVNDIYLNDLKISGILVESVIKNSTIEYLIIGIGINCFNQDFKELNNIASSIEKETNIIVNRNLLIIDIIEGIEKLLNDFNNTYYLEEYRKYQYLKNKEVVISTLKEEFIGTYYDIDELGGLVINLNGDLKTFYNGEVIKTRVYENK